jgi:hypothetical protein
MSGEQALQRIAFCALASSTEGNRPVYGRTAALWAAICCLITPSCCLYCGCTGCS